MNSIPRLWFNGAKNCLEILQHKENAFVCANETIESSVTHYTEVVMSVNESTICPYFSKPNSKVQMPRPIGLESHPSVPNPEPEWPRYAYFSLPMPHVPYSVSYFLSTLTLHNGTAGSLEKRISGSKNWTQVLSVLRQPCQPWYHQTPPCIGWLNSLRATHLFIWEWNA